jgi:hypothetical protein
MKNQMIPILITLSIILTLFVFNPFPNAKLIESKIEVHPKDMAKTTSSHAELDYWVIWKRQIIRPIGGNRNSLLPQAPGC